MSKVLSSLPTLWFKCLSKLYLQRCFSSQIKGSWNEPPICEGRVISRKDKKCHPKTVSCDGALSACGITRWPVCDEPESIPESHLMCCCDHRVSKNPCNPSPKKKQKHKDKEPFKSMWETIDMEPECPKLVPRLDDTHYKPSDKINRVYTRTWETCKPVMRPKKICNIDEVCTMQPPYERRSKEKILDLTAREKDSNELKIEYCLIRRCIASIPKNPNITKPNKCVKVVMPCCRKVAKNLKCHVNRGHTKCMKDCCPYPSFSECDHPKFVRNKQDDCHCLDFTHQCEADRYLLRKNRCKLPPPLPGWPPHEKPK